MPFQPAPRQDNAAPQQDNAAPRQDNAFSLPFDIQQYLKPNSVIKVRVREYDLSIGKNPSNNSTHGNEQPFQRFALPNSINDRQSTSSNNVLVARSNENFDLNKAYEQVKVKTELKSIKYPSTSKQPQSTPQPYAPISVARSKGNLDLNKAYEEEKAKTESRSSQKKPQKASNSSSSSSSNYFLVVRSKANLNLNQVYEQECLAAAKKPVPKN